MSNPYVNDLKQPAPQNEPIVGRESDMTPNRAGGYGFKIDLWQQMLRFLILGAEGGTYYATQRNMSIENVGVLKNCLNEDPDRYLALLQDVDANNRIPKRDAFNLALALAMTTGSAEVRTKATRTASSACRIFTHVAELLSVVKQLRNGKLSGRSVRTLISNWYNSFAGDPSRLSYQMVKYRSRAGFTHRDMLRIGHVKPANEQLAQLFGWAVKEGTEPLPDFPRLNWLNWPDDVSNKVAADRIRRERIVRECIPTELLNSLEVWDALLEDMPLTAMIRNLGKMGSVGLLKPLSAASKEIVTRLLDEAAIINSRVHPVQVLAAWATYKSGSGFRGNLQWTPDQQVIEALDRAFHTSFKNVEPTGKRFLIGLDVSGSMGWGNVAGIPGLTPREAAAALVLQLIRTEPWCHVVAFSTNVKPVEFQTNASLNEVVDQTSRIPMGGTDCSLPILYATKNRLDVDVFVTITDNETWTGHIHPAKALNSYRKARNNSARSAVIACTSTGYSIADPADPGMLDLVGFDTASPRILREFALGYQLPT